MFNHEPLIAFHGKRAIKDKYLSRIIKHSRLDEIVKGKYWQNGKGCAVGCTIHGHEHKKYETELGIPEWVAKLEDHFFENLPNEVAKDFPRQFLDAIPVGFDNWPILHHDYATHILKCKAVDTYDLVADTTNMALHATMRAARIAEESVVKTASWRGMTGEDDQVWLSASKESARSTAWCATWIQTYIDLSNRFIELLKRS